MKLIEKKLQYLKGVGPIRAKALKRLGLETIADLIYHFPKEYQDRSNIKKIAELRSEEKEIFLAKVVEKQEQRTTKGQVIAKLLVTDGYSYAHIVFFNRPYLLKPYFVGQQILIYGKVQRRLGEVQIQNAEIEPFDQQGVRKKIVPIYPSTEGVSQTIWRNLMAQALHEVRDCLPDCLPDCLREKYHLPTYQEAVFDLHFPETMLKKERARKRLAFEEFFLFQLALGYKRAAQKREKRVCVHPDNGPLLESLRQSIPFSLTEAQQRVIEEIRQDLQRPEPMNRLLQGDVGSGKTIVAAFTLAFALQGGVQVALMAPTEILAEQHFKTLDHIFTSLGITVGLLTGSLTKKKKDCLLAAIKAGTVHLIVGTHALIQKEVVFANLGMAVIDEQHRFGVLQRGILWEKGSRPDILVMTATPIPRTLSLTLYGDLDVSVLDELPPGRQPVETESIPHAYREKVYEFLRSKILEGRQAYIVCPLIEESDKLSLQAAVDLADHLATDIFPDFSVGLLHGKMKGKEKDAVMALFRQGALHILVTTTVIEVGVDVPNATVMVIENSERFGLSQLHQLRGRVGRGSEQSFCLLLSEHDSERIKIMTKVADGFCIAEEDLKIRGPGEFLGVKQHGFPMFKIANLVTDQRILEVARKEAFLLVQEDPDLEGNACLKKAAKHFVCCLGERRN